MKHQQKLLSILIAFVFLFAAFPGYAIGDEFKPAQYDNRTSKIPAANHHASVLFINVGRADAALIQIDGLYYLIDTGSKSSALQVLDALAMYHVERLEAVFLTHTHSDHTGGLKAIAQEYEVGTLYSSAISKDKKNGENKIDTLASKLSLNHEKLSAGDTVSVSADIKFEVLGPLVYSHDDNDNSLILRLSVNDTTILFCGDMQFAEEISLLEAGIDLYSDILKVGNHGNPDATSAELIAAVQPKIAIISTNTLEDQNSANERVIALLDGAQVFSTEDYTLGILLNLGVNGEVNISNPQPLN